MPILTNWADFINIEEFLNKLPGCPYLMQLIKSQIIEYTEIHILTKTHTIAIFGNNNHYVGFGPDTVNIFRNMTGLPDARWEEKEMEIQKQEDQYPTHESKQFTLSEFMT